MTLKEKIDNFKSIYYKELEDLNNKNNELIRKKYELEGNINRLEDLLYKKNQEIERLKGKLEHKEEEIFDQLINELKGV